MFKKRAYVKYQNLKCKRRGFSIIESLILLIVISVVIGGILQTSALTISMQIKGRQRIDSFSVASSWFSALDSMNINNGSNFDAAVEKANKIVGAKSTYISDPKLLESSHDGVFEVCVNVWDGDKSYRTLTKYFNKYTPETVSDDRGGF